MRIDESGFSSKRTSVKLLCERGYTRLNIVEGALRGVGHMWVGDAAKSVRLGAIYSEIDNMTDAEMDELAKGIKAWLDKTGTKYDDLDPQYINEDISRKFEKRTKSIRATAHVEKFKDKMKSIAYERLDANAKELAALQQRYSSYISMPLAARRFSSTFSDLMKAIKTEQEFHRRDIHLSVDEADERMKYRDYPESSVMRETWKNITQQREYIAFARKLLRQKFPVLDALDTGSIKVSKTSDDDLYKKIVAAFDRARKAQIDVRRKIETEDMPLYKLDPIVFATLSFFSITEKSRDEFSVAVLAWLAEERTKDWAVKFGSTILGIGLAAACFIPGIGVGAIIALGAVGAGIGGAAAAYEFEMADDLHQAGESQRGGSHQLISDPDAAKTEYMWGIVNIILAGVDLFIAGGEVFSLGKVLKRFDTVKDGLLFVDRVGDTSKAAKLLSRMDKLADGQKMLTRLLSADIEDAAEITKFINGLDETFLLRAEVLANRSDDIKDFAARIRIEKGIDEFGMPCKPVLPDEVMNRFDDVGKRLVPPMKKPLSRSAVLSRYAELGVSEKMLDAAIAGIRKVLKDEDLDSVEVIFRPRAANSDTHDFPGELFVKTKTTKFPEESETIRIIKYEDGRRQAVLRSDPTVVLMEGTSDWDLGAIRVNGRTLLTAPEYDPLYPLLKPSEGDHKIYEEIQISINDIYEKKYGAKTTLINHEDQINGKMQPYVLKGEVAQNHNRIGANRAGENDHVCLRIRVDGDEVSFGEMNYFELESESGIR